MYLGIKLEQYSFLQVKDSLNLPTIIYYFMTDTDGNVGLLF